MSAEEWRAQAAAAIAATIAACRREGLGLAATCQRVDAAYPFRPHSPRPYKAWLAARDEALAEAARLLAWEQGGPVALPAPARTPMEAYLEELDE